MHIDKIKESACELLTLIYNTMQPASEVINTYTRAHKSIGSKDRRQLTDICWNVIRNQAKLNYALPNATWIDKINLLEKGLPDLSGAPDWVKLEVPEWVIPLIDKYQDELPALLQAPDIILRANGNREVIQKLLLDEGIETSATPLSPVGLILKNRVNLNTSKAYLNGFVEVQDEASQLVALKTGIKPRDTVLDYCAGAGGKSLIFEQMMMHKGKIIAHDISARSLQNLQKRAVRAKARCIQTTTNLPQFMKKNDTVHFTHVVVDAPCSGTGTWRRCPDARFKLTPENFDNLLKKQATILHQASAYVETGAFLCYMTCSITKNENIMQVQSFLKRHKNFKLCSHQQFSPYKSKTDGLFVAIMQRI